MRISNYNKPIIDKLLELDNIYKADIKHSTWQRSGWDCDLREYVFTIEAKTKYELEKLIEKYTTEKRDSVGDFGISLSGSEYEVIERYTKQCSILD